VLFVVFVISELLEYRYYNGMPTIEMIWNYLVLEYVSVFRFGWAVPDEYSSRDSACHGTG